MQRAYARAGAWALARGSRCARAAIGLLWLVCLGLGTFAAMPAGADIPSALKALAGGDFAGAADHLRPLAESGDVAAQVALGQILRAPANPQRAPEEAFRWFTRAAEQGHADARFWLGIMHRLGESVARDADQAVQQWRSAAEAGSVRAQGALAQALFTGDGVAKDADEAVRWARKAADRGNVQAQTVLAQAHLKGEGGAARSLDEFLRWTRRAASQGNRPSMEALAVSYHLGTGVPQDFVQAHMWANLAAARGSARAHKLRDELAAKMTPEQVAEAQKAASRWRPVRVAQAIGTPDASGKRRTGTGSGFIVGLPGYVLTNNHVVEQCTEVRAPARKAVLKVLARDAKNDLALLEGELAVAETARFRLQTAPRLGEQIMVAGFPLSDLLAQSLNVTTGTVSALAGPKNNDTLFQITAPIQHGNSGGPVLDAQGEVIGVVVSKLNALQVAMVTGDVPQNVNFAISGAVARNFIEAHGVDLPDDEALPPRGAILDAPERARRFTLLIECWR
ncbi:MAG: SEL1-like repeat protein [Burkholderiales bacterium]|nr:SEL1-like repeat protein [Burkholderiales bacterium]